MNTNERLAPGSIIGHYRITRFIERGGMGEVYEAVDELLKRKVAIKIISKDLAKDEKALQRFLSEGRVVAQINHQNIVTIHNLGEDNGIYYMAMEFVEGDNLKRRLKEKPFTARELIPLMQQILSGVHALHQSGIIHRDLKPNNIILRNDGIIKILDFGIAKTHREESGIVKTQEGFIIGSIAYLSPELVTDGEPSAQSDIWALGLVLYEMLLGHQAIREKNELRAIDKIKSFQVTFSEEQKVQIPRRLQSILTRMCAQSQTVRYKNIQEVWQDYSAMMAADFGVRLPTGLSSDPSSISSTYYMRRRIKKRNSQWVSITVGLAFVGLLSFSAWQFLKTREAKQRAEIAQEIPLPPPLENTLPPASDNPSDTSPSAPAEPEHSELNVPTENTPLINAQPQLPLSSPRTLKAAALVDLNFHRDVIPRSIASVKKSILNPPHFAWTASARASQYRIQISKDKGFKNLVLNEKISTTKYVWADVTPGSFHWRVQALGGRNSSPFSQPKSLKVRLPAPILIPPPEKIVPVTNPADLASPDSFDLQWSPVPLSEIYRVETAKSETFSKIEKSIAATTESLRLELPPGTHFVRVLAASESGEALGVVSTPIRLSLKKELLIKMPETRIPESGSVIRFIDEKTTPVYFNWTAIENAQDYSIQFALDSKFTTIFHETKSNSNQYLIDKTFPVGVIYWRVKARYETFESKWSKSSRFKLIRKS